MAERRWHWVPGGLVPLGLALLFGALVTEGHLNFGGGDKDIFLVLPLLVWSIVFLPVYLVLWWLRRSPGRAAGWAAAISTAVVVLAWIVLFIVVSVRLL